jgi:hypothetical protein
LTAWVSFVSEQVFGDEVEVGEEILFGLASVL